ncbi:hypothetical protein LCGC14_3107560 [marine sediment metagenome]|uniref:Glycine radical domain-containing protein n=1 Tax=marine sediment metagenome TaxID=412755 RepID=A0A0F8YVY5_9ZZZZ
MERRFELRKEELMADCEVHPAVFAGMISRLEGFAEPFFERLRRPEQKEHAQTYVRGLLSDVEKKNAEAIANVPGVDGLLIGAEDLSLARGKFVDSKTAHAKVKDDVKYLTEVCRKTGKAAGVIALSPEDLVERLKEGYQLICANFDVDHARNQFRRMREVFNEAIGNSGA